MASKCKVLIAYHKPSELIKSDIYIPIQVGRDIMLESSKDGSLSSKSRRWMEKNLIGDNTGDNISALNRYFNEMSALYWAWKNQESLDNPQYIGLMHYRRHFIFSQKNYSKFTWLMGSPIYSYEFIDKKYMEMLDEKYVNDLIEQYDIIASHPYNANNLNDGHYYRNCKERYSEVSKTSPIWYEKMEDIIRKDYPQYVDELNYLSREPNHYLCNMFVMKKELFDEYCSFAFDVLFRLYDDFKKETVDIWQTRAIGFLAEFLTSIFISTYRVKHPQKVKELDMTYVENPDLRSDLKNVKDFIYSKRRYWSYKSTTFLGKTKIKPKNNFNDINYIKQQNEYLIKMLKDSYRGITNDIGVKIQAALIHSRNFAPYKNCYKDRDVVLCASGPSIINFQKIDDAVYVGVNKSFLNKNLDLDYLFIQDDLHGQIMNLANQYVGNNCQKFYGKISDNRLPYINPIQRIPAQYISYAGAKQYILENNLGYNFAYNLEMEPVGDFAGTVFSAMQFILYTHPRRIYLAGCDCSSGYFYDEKSTNSASYQVESWIKIKEFAQKYYPDVEIISINPVGLKGIFKDIYQKETCCV